MKKWISGFIGIFLVALVSAAYGTVDSDTNRADYDPDGLVLEFTYDFRVDFANDLVVYEDGVVVTGGYSVTGVGSDLGGSVIFDTAPVASIEKLTLIREVDATQLTAYPAYGRFPAAAHEKALDKLTFLIQQIKERMNRTTIAPIDVDPDINWTLPDYRAGEYWIWDPGAKRIRTSTNEEILERFNGFENSLAALLNREAAFEKEAIYIKGRITEDDGGQGVFIATSDDISTEVTVDTQHGVYVPFPSDPTGAGGGWIRQTDGVLLSSWFGTSSSGTAALNTVAFQAWANLVTYYNGYAVAVVPPGLYDIEGGFSFNTDGLTVYAYNATFRQNSTNAVTITLNSGAQPDQSGSKSRIYWSGGYFINTTGYASNTNTGILIRDLKIGALKDVRGTGFGSSFIENSAETAFDISDISAFSNKYHVWTPDFYTNKSNPQNLTYNRCALSIHGTSGIKIDSTINQLSLRNCSFTGVNSIVATTGVSPSVPSLDFNIDNCDFEQGTTGDYISITNPNGVELQKLSIRDCGFGGITARIATLEHINSLIFEGNRCVCSYTNGWLVLDADCENIDIGDNYFYGSGSITYACDRREIRMFPYTVNLSMIGEGVLTDFNNTAYSTGTGTVDMSAELTPWNAMLPPLGYFIKVEARDSGSASGTAEFAFYDGSGALVTQRTVGVVLSSHPNSSRLTDSGVVLADTNGDINYSVTATGASTLRVYGKVQQVLY
jgi:hypothetical protein